MRHTENTAWLIDSTLSSFGIPLLDDAFDPDAEEILEHNDMFPLHLSESPEEFSF